MKAAEAIRAGLAAQTLADRLVAWLSPEKGLARFKARTILAASAGGYNGAATSRRATSLWRPRSGSADSDTLGNLSTLRARARDLSRNTPVAAGAVATVVSNVVGTGLVCQPEIDTEFLGLSEEEADAFETAALREWRHFAATCDISGVQCFEEMQALALRMVLDSGDGVVLRKWREDPGAIYGTRLQFVEADRLATPGFSTLPMPQPNGETLVAGVYVDRDGRHVAYSIADRHPGDFRATAIAFTRIAARTAEGDAAVLHLYDRLRPDQTRGVPYLSPVVEHLKQIGDYSDAEVTAAVVGAMITVFIESPGPSDTDDNPPIGEKDASLEANQVKLGNGAIVGLGPGEKATSPIPSRPNTNFDPFMQAFLRQVGVALELPFEVLVQHFTSSYSASRAALEMAWQLFRRRRKWLAEVFCQPVYEWFMAEAVARGRLSAPGFFADPLVRAAYCRAAWIGQSKMSLDPLREANADKVDVELGVKTREQICAERTGGEFADKVAQLAKEKAALDAAGLTPAPAPAAAAPAKLDPSADPEAGDASDEEPEDA